MFIGSITTRWGKSFVERLVILSGTVVTWCWCFTIIHPRCYLHWRKCIQKNVFSLFGWVKFIKFGCFHTKNQTKLCTKIVLLLTINFLYFFFFFALKNTFNTKPLFRMGIESLITFHIYIRKWNWRNGSGILFGKILLDAQFYFLLPL